MADGWAPALTDEPNCDHEPPAFSGDVPDELLTRQPRLR
jgi:hypothetical protein